MKLSFKSKKYALIAIIVAVLVAFFVCFFLWRILDNKPLQEEEEKHLEIFSPLDSQLIELDYNFGEYSIEVAGKSSFFTTSTRAKVLDDNGEILAEAVLAPSLSLLAKRSFAHVFKIRGPLTQEGVVWVYEENIATGDVVQETNISIIFEAEAPWGTPEFKASEKVFFSSDLSGQNVYYLRDGNIWHFDISNRDSVRKQVFLDKEDDILIFSFSPDGKRIAYAIDQFDLDKQKYSDTQPLGSSGFGDTILLYDIKTSKEVVIYENDREEYMEIASMLFALDSDTLYFSNNSVWSIDLSSENLQRFDVNTFSHRGLCAFYLIEELSPNGLLLMVKRGCYEGGDRFLINVDSRDIANNISELSSSPCGDI